MPKKAKKPQKKSTRPTPKAKVARPRRNDSVGQATDGSSGRAAKPVKVATKVAAKKTTVAAPAKNIPRRSKTAVYSFTEDKAILPAEDRHLPSRKSATPASFKNLPAHLQPLKVVDGRVYLTGTLEDVERPTLISVQLRSYRWFLGEGLAELLQEISPITDFSGRKMEIHFLGHLFDPPKYTSDECRKNNLTFEAALKAHTQLVNKETGEIKEQDVFLGSIPLMTERGTFVVNGIERVVVNQLVRSPGVFFREMPENPRFHGAKIIPKRGVWLEVETDRKGIVTCKIDRKRKIHVTQLLRIFGYETDSMILDLFTDLATGEKDFIRATLEKDPAKTVEEAYQSIYRKIRPGDLATPENAKHLIDGLFFDFKKYDMGQIARYKMNRRFNLNTPNDERHRIFQTEDWVQVLRELIRLNTGEGVADDIDHLSNRRVRSVGELVQNKFRVGLIRTERIAKDRM
ncbi:MAG: hypothetical protein AAB853_04770, partial [Patescibacteria group bacterium]